MTASQFCSVMGLNYYEMIHGDLADGMTIHDRKRDMYTVVYNETVDTGRLLFTLAHEVGHIYMEHDDKDVYAEEIEANAFSTQLLLPDYSVVRIYSDFGVMSQKILSDIFGVSMETAKNRLIQLGRMVRVRVTENDVRIWELRKDFIGRYFDMQREYDEMKDAARTVSPDYRLDALTEYERIWEAASRLVFG